MRVHCAHTRKLDLCVKRYYVVHAVQNGKQDRVNEFFDRMTQELRAYPVCSLHTTAYLAVDIASASGDTGNLLSVSLLICW